MSRITDKGDTSARTFLGRLRSDVGGNTLAIMAASLVPIIGFTGSAVDMGRSYVVKVRLQQACDAGVLAGRKLMTDTSLVTPLEPAASAQAQAFFKNNFKSDFYQSNAVSFTPTKGADSNNATVANAVNGTATATVPMAVMGFFGIKPTKITVACQAVFDLADTDVMFVLDTTGSMACYPSDPANCANGSAQSYTRDDGTTGYAQVEKPPVTSGSTTTYSKIESLRRAVMLFDTTIRASADATTHFRYGFVPYSSSVNIGNEVKSLGYLQNTQWTYQSRHLSPAIPAGIPNAIAGDYASGAATTFSLTGVPLVLCVPQRSPVSGFAKTGYTWTDQGYLQARSYYNLSWSLANGGTCSGTQQALRWMWRYESVTLDISQWSAGAAVTNPSRLDGSQSKWRGCVEELDTTTGSTFDVEHLPDDLNPEIKPTSATNKWRPMWPEVEWLRNSTTATDVRDEDVAEDNTGNLYNLNYRGGGLLDRGGSASCGRVAKRLQTWTAQGVHDYLYNTDFRAFGGTYHDVGMIWGTRMLSPKGIFGADTAAWPGRKDPSRNIVFVTDGLMAPSQTSYGQYGVEYWDNRTGGQGNSSTDYDNHTARFRVECDAAKKQGFTIYVVAVGLDISNDLTYCASPGQTFSATSTDDLTDAFESIAKRIAQLRITQ